VTTEEIGFGDIVDVPESFLRKGRLGLETVANIDFDDDDESFGGGDTLDLRNSNIFLIDSASLLGILLTGFDETTDRSNATATT
jgi:hypothetical protein